MKQKIMCIYSSTCNECNGHTDSFKRISTDKFLCANGSRLPNHEIKIDKTKEECVQIQPNMKYNRSQRCLEHNIIVQSSLNNAPIYSKFAFHRIIHFIGILLLFVVCSTVNGQQQESRQRTQNTGE